MVLYGNNMLLKTLVWRLGYRSLFPQNKRLLSTDVNRMRRDCKGRRRPEHSDKHSRRWMRIYLKS